MSFPLGIYLGAWLGAGLCTGLALPLWRLACGRWGLVDDPGHRKIHSASIPLAGGLAVLTGMVLPIGFGLLALRMGLFDAPAVEAIMYGFGKRGGRLTTILSGAAGMVFLGSLDDRFELRPLWKFGGQWIIASAVALAGVRITLFVPNGTFSYFMTVLWILTVTNAFNFMDNMNGLCAGLGIVAAGCFAAGAMAHGQYLVASTACLACGALLGFLPYNYPKAVVFLGDAGSHLTGYLLSILAILPHFHTVQHPHRWAVLAPLIILAVPLIDLAWVVLLRWRLGAPFYLGDTNHLSHRLVRRGLSPARAVLVIWALAAATGFLGLWLQLP